MSADSASSLTEIITPGLLLRALQLSDAREIFMLRSDPIVNQYTGRKLAETIDDATEFIKKILAGIGSGNTFYWAIVPKGQQQLAGTICLWNIDWDNKKAEIGYELLPQWQVKGIMTEALKVITRCCFEQMNLQTIEAELEANNLPSVKLLKRCGFVLAKEQGNDEMIIYRLAK